MSDIHLTDRQDAWIIALSEIPQMLTLDHIWLGSDFSANSVLGNNRSLTFDSPNPNAKRCTRNILSLILNPKKDLIEVTCAELRQNLLNLMAVLILGDEDGQAWWDETEDEDDDEDDDDDEDEDDENEDDEDDDEDGFDEEDEWDEEDEEDRSEGNGHGEPQD